MKDVSECICLVTIKALEDQASGSVEIEFGTGFFIYENSTFMYAITCAHVVEKAQEQAEKYQILVNGETAFLEAYSLDADIAVLKVNTAKEYPMLQLSDSAYKEQKVRIIGIPPFDKRRERRELIALDGILSKSSKWFMSGRNKVPIWYLALDDPEFRLKPGFSGAPVVDQATSNVVGILSIQIKDGHRGIAICTSSIKLIWEQLPKEVFVESPLSDLRDQSLVTEFQLSLLKDEIVSKKSELEQVNQIISRLRKRNLFSANEREKIDLESHIRDLESQKIDLVNALVKLETELTMKFSY
ncbi:serine protease [Sphaerothrix gracilis]|uniref:S1 family peptidase n=1 Tax=Sphaerothrix gracilis TaxID=3151835 RepID=UPI0031FC9AD7